MGVRPRILFTCGREAQYTRNLLVLRALRQNCDVLEITDSRPGSLLQRHVRLLPRLLRALRGSFDLVFVGFYGFLLLQMLARLTRKPLLFDAYLSTWDTLCFDRQLFAPRSIPGRLAYWLDQSTSLHASHTLLDTQEHCHYFTQAFSLGADKVSPYYVGYDDRVFYPRAKPAMGNRFDVFFYGSFAPLHGVDTIVRAAKLLDGEGGIDIRVVGGGLTHETTRRLAESLGVRCLTFEPAVPYLELPERISEANVCLGGPFGSNAKAGRVIAGKTFQFLAMAKPTIVADSPANREVFEDLQDVLMCKSSDGQSLAAAIVQLRDDRDLREHIARVGYEHCRARFNLETQAQAMSRVVSSLL